MKVHSKSNNFIAILIALLLFAAGFILYFVYQQTEQDNAKRSSNAGVEIRLESQADKLTA